jgi:uncharacterized protein (DUF2141 family)
MLQYLFLIIFSGFFNTQSSSETHKVVVEITHLRNTEGRVCLGVYKDEASFEAEKPFYYQAFSKDIAKNGSMRVTIPLPKGTYGIALLDDENGNYEMDFGWVLPEEGFGFSNYWHTGMTKPKLKAFSFEVKKPMNPVKIKVKYL